MKFERYKLVHFVISTLMCFFGMAIAIEVGIFGITGTLLAGVGGLFYTFKEVMQLLLGRMGVKRESLGVLLGKVIGNPNLKFDWPGFVCGLIPGIAFGGSFWVLFVLEGRL